jgi:hypothetical protein
VNPGDTLALRRRSRGPCPFFTILPGPAGPGCTSLGRRGGLGGELTLVPSPAQPARALQCHFSGAVVPTVGRSEWQSRRSAPA